MRGNFWGEGRTRERDVRLFGMFFGNMGIIRHHAGRKSAAYVLYLYHAKNTITDSDRTVSALICLLRGSGHTRRAPGGT